MNEKIMEDKDNVGEQLPGYILSTITRFRDVHLQLCLRNVSKTRKNTDYKRHFYATVETI